MRKKGNFKGLWIILALAVVIGFMAGCEILPKQEDDFEDPIIPPPPYRWDAVSSITNVPTSGKVGQLTLSGTVNPSTNVISKDITWSVVSAGTTGAVINGSTLTTTATGIVTVRATIRYGKAWETDYTQDFTITINPPDITYTVTQTGGTDGITDSTGLVFTFGTSVDSFGLTATDISVSGAASKGAEATFTGSGTNRTLLSITVSAAGPASVSINKDGIETVEKSVTVYKEGEYVPGTPGLAYELINNNTAYRVRKGTVTSGAVFIPAFYEDKPVTEIGSSNDSYSTGAFSNINITSVTISTSVTSIGNSAFTYCTGLASITIPNSVTSIGDSAFYRCTGLTSITIPNNVTSISYNAFGGCTGLTTITIPNSVTSIGTNAFSGCTGLTTITIPNSVTSIGDSAFTYCTGLASITIPNSVTSIGDYAFRNCTGLTTITIPNSVTSIDHFAFYRCTGLTSITVEASKPNYSSEGGILYNKAKTTLIQAPGAISGSVTIPNSVTSIGYNAFLSCSSLTTITIPNSVTSIGDEAFSDCTGLTTITIPNSVTTVRYSAFGGWTTSQKIYVPWTLGNKPSGWNDYWNNACNAQIVYQGQ
jgi:hypothetical protein